MNLKKKSGNKQTKRLTPFHILAGSMSGHTCCKREPAIHWPYTAHTAVVDFRRLGSTVPNNCTQPKYNRENKIKTPNEWSVF